MNLKKSKLAKLKKVVGILMSLILLMQFITPIKIAKADDVSSLNFIKDIKITDNKGNPLEENIPKNSSVKVTCSFEIPNKAEIKAGDTYKIKIPQEIYAEGTNRILDLKTPDNGSVGTFKLVDGGVGIITFTDYASTHSNVSGEFSFETRFDKEKIKNEEKTKLVFVVGEKTKTIEVKFQQDEENPEDVNVRKYASNFDRSKNEIEWTIEVECGKKPLKNVSVVDTIGDGQEFVANSIKVDSVAADSQNYKVEGNKITYTFPGEVTGSKRIILKTKLTDSFFNSNMTSVGNKVELNIDNKNISNYLATQNVDRNWISKSGSLDEENNIITWKITLNNNGKIINNAVMEDLIPENTEYVEDSLSASDSNMKQYLSTEKDSSGRTNKVVFRGRLDRSFEIEFKTRILNLGNLNNQSLDKIRNEAGIVGDGIPDNTKAETTVEVKKNLIYKHAEGYDLDKNEATWKIDVNKSKAHLTGVKVVDEIPIGQEYVDGSFSIEGDNSVLGEMKYTPSEKGDSDKTGTLIYDFGNKAIDNSYTITFRTKVTDFTDEGSGGKNIKNTAKLSADYISDVESTGQTYINLKLIEKKAEYSKGHDYIKWNILVNKNKIDLKEGVIKDTLAKGLELDTSTIKLNKMNLTNGLWGDATEGEEVEIGKDDFTYNMDTGEFVFKIHDMGSEVYRLQFITNVTNSALGSVSNTASFDATGEKVSSKSTEEVKDVFFIEGDASGKGELGTIRIKKVDDNNEDKPLQGAKFKIYDKFGNQIGDEVSTDKDGIIEFHKIRFDVPYTIEEIQAPEGYKLSDNPEENKRVVTIKGNQNVLLLKGHRFNNKVVAINEKTWQTTWENEKNKTIKGNVDLLKVDENGNKLTGAEFDVYKDVNDNGVYDEGIDELQGDMIENSKNHSLYELNDLEAGSYLVKETKAPEGYILDGNYHAFTISEDGKTVTVETQAGKNFVNHQAVGSMEITKVDADYPENKLSGAIFEVYRDVDNNGEFNKDVDKSVGNMMDKDGVYSVETLPVGRYFVKEIKAPKGYVLDDNYHAFEVASNGQNVKVETEAGKNFINNRIKGNVKLLKVDENGNKLTGAKFEVYDDVNNNGVYDKDVDTVQGDMIANAEDNSLYELNDLVSGKYLLKETKAPEGFVLDVDYHSFEITENGETVTVENQAGKNFVNSKIKGSAYLLKVDEDGNKLTGATFEVYNDVNNNGVYDEGIDTLQGDMIENVENNSLYELNNLEKGKYLVKEVLEPEGYVLDTNYHAVEISKNKEVVNVETEAGKSFVNNRIKGNVELLKVDESGNKLTGAEFKVYKDVNKNGVYDKEVDTLQGDMIENTEDNSLYELNDLLSGKYLVKETKAPEGFVLDDNYHAFEITDNGKTVKVETEAGKNFVNHQALGNVELTKVDADYPENKLSGAVFEVYKDVDNNGEFNESVDKLVGNMIDNDGVYSMKNLPLGKYFVRETKAPEGYVLDTNYHAFEIAVSGETVNVETEAGKKFINNRIKGNVDLLKVDENENKLTGAKFEVYKDVNGNGKYDSGDIFEGNMIENSENNSLYELNDLVQGKYLVKETEAPEGYVLDTSYHQFEITENGKTVRVENGAGKNFVNNKIKGSAYLLKVDESGNKLTGANFEVYNDVNSNGVYDDGIDTLQGNMVENSEDNSLYELNDLVYGKYLLKETKAPDGYILDKNYHAFEIAVNGESVNVETEARKNFINNRIKGNVDLLKVDENGNRLTGAKFEVYKDVNNNGAYDEGIDTLQGDMVENTENNALYELNDLVSGNYLLRETKAPEGYVLDEDYHAFEIIENGKTVRVETEADKNFVNHRALGSVELTKVDADYPENKLTGATFEVYKDVDNNGEFNKDIDKLVGNMMNSNGVYSMRTLPVGKYFVKETKSPEGYVLDENYHAFEIDKNGEVVNVETEAGKNFINTRIKGNVDLLKVDEKGNKLTGAKFEVYKDVNEDGKYDAEDILQGDMVENTENKFHYELNDLVSGKYLVKETKAPEGYVLDTNYHAFEITENGKTVRVETEAGKNFINHSIKGSIELTKVDKDNTSKKLPGATFEVYKDVNNNGKYDEGVDLSAGTMIDNNGVYTMKNLVYGNYVIKETKAPKGYDINSDVVTFSIKDNNDALNIKFEDTKTPEIPQRFGKVQLLKVDEEGNRLLGAEFKVYKDTNSNGKYDEGIDALQGNIVENNNESSNYELDNLSAGKYLVKETKAPEGFILDEEYHAFEITADGETVNIETEAGKNFINNRIKGNVDLLKVDKNGNKLTGATFEVYRDVNENGKYDSGDTFQGNMVENSKNNSLYELNDLSYGKYLVKETKAPEGFLLDENYHAFEISENGKTVTVETEAGKNFVNYQAIGSVELTKVDADYPENKLTGATFEVYKDVDNNGEFNKDVDKLVGNMTDNDGVYSMKTLPLGKYFVKETKAPEGYVLDTNYHAFEINENGKTVTVETEVGKNFINNIAKGSIEITKVDKDNTSKKLPGATFEVYKDVNNNGKYDEGVDISAGTMIDDNGVYTMKDLVYGNYVIRETKAPEGYDINSDVVTFSIKDNNDALNIKFEDTKTPEIPQRFGKVQLLKVDEDGNRLLGAEFKVYKDTNSNGKYDDGIDTLQGNMIENNNESSNYELGNLSSGKYLVKETKAPEGFVLDENYHAFEITANGETVDIETEAGKNFVNYQAVGSVELTKVDADYPENKLTGATFEVYKDVDNNGEFNKDVDKLVGNMTDNDGVYSMKTLPLGKYFVKETKAPRGFVLDTNYHPFQISRNGEIVNVATDADKNFINNRIKGNVDLLKVDENGNRLTGAEFEVYKDVNENGKYDSGDVLQGKMIENTRISSLYELNDLSYGKYLLKETEAPEGYVLDENYHAFEIRDNGKTVTVETEAGKNFVNYQAVGSVELTKVDADYPENKLTGAVFEVYKDVENSGEFNKDVDKLVGNMIDNDGVYSMKTLPLGKYFVKETKAPEGYVLDANYHAFKIVANGENVNVETESGKNFINNRIKGNVELIKVDKADVSKKLPGATFKVYKDANNNGKYDEGVDLVAGTMVDNDGTYTIENLSYGNYIIRETKAPEGYDINSEVVSFSIKDNNDLLSIRFADSKKPETPEVFGKVQLLKVDEEGNRLLGAEFKVYKDVNNNGLYDEGIDTLQGNMIENNTDSSNHELDNLPIGKYLVKETKVPEGFVLDTNYHAFEITANGETINIETESGKNFINNRIKGNIDLLKVDENGNKLTGAEFEVYKDVNEDGKYDSGDTFQGNMIENSRINSLYELNDLSYGKYLVKETKAPEGYVLDKNYHPFEITENGRTVTVETEAGKNFVNSSIKGNVELTKVDKEDASKKLPGATFEVYRDVNNNSKYDEGIDLVAGTMVDNAGTYTMEDLVYGNYVIRETKAPEGYDISSEVVAFSIRDNNDVISIKFEDSKKPEIPQILGKVQLLKVDDNGNRLLGSVFKVYKDVNNNSLYDEGIDTLQGNMIENNTDSSNYELGNLPSGKYLIKETECPEGFVLDENYHPFEINTNGEVVKVETESGKNFVNHIIRGNIELIKVDKNDSSKMLKGAEFEVYRDVNNNGKYDEGIDLVTGTMTDNDGIYTMKNLAYGNYLIKEIKAPEGYYLNTEVVPFSIKDNNDVISIKFVDSKKPETPEVFGKVQLLKVDENGNRLLGAEFKVYKDINNNGKYDEGIDILQGNMIENNTDSSNYELNNLSNGKYLLKEIKAPKGYILDENYHPFEITTNGEVVNVETESGKNFINNRIPNKPSKPDNPIQPSKPNNSQPIKTSNGVTNVRTIATRTGDNSGVGLIVIIMATMVAVMIFEVKRKKVK